ncbi:MAG: hypothetical protein WCJ95_18950 [Mariniphaga sp.]
MKNEISSLSFSELADAEEHDLFHLLKSAERIKVSPEIPVKEVLSLLELEVYNFLLNLNRDFPARNEEFNLEFLIDNLGFKYNADELVDAFRNLDKKYYTECAFDDAGSLVWVKLL